MKIQEEIVSKIKASFEAYTTECGGLLGMKDNIICKFIFDSGTNNVAEYSPNISLFNKTLKKWATDNIIFAGIIHSHPNDCRILSYEDEMTIKKIYDAVACDYALYFPIVTLCEGKAIITAYKYENGKIEKDEIKIM